MSSDLIFLLRRSIELVEESRREESLESAQDHDDPEDPDQTPTESIVITFIHSS